MDAFVLEWVGCWVSGWVSGWVAGLSFRTQNNSGQHFAQQREILLAALPEALGATWKICHLIVGKSIGPKRRAKCMGVASTLEEIRAVYKQPGTEGGFQATKLIGCFGHDWIAIATVPRDCIGTSTKNYEYSVSSCRVPRPY